MNIFSLSQEHFDFDFDSDSFLFADKIATEQYEYNDSFRKIEQIKYAIQEADETSRAIENIQTVIAQEGIKSRHEAKAISIALAHLTRQVGFKPVSYSLEGYGNGIALEGLGSVIKAIYDAIVNAIKKLSEYVSRFFSWIFGSSSGGGGSSSHVTQCSVISKKAVAVQEKISTLPKEAKKKVDDVISTKENADVIKKYEEEIEKKIDIDLKSISTMKEDEGSIKQSDGYITSPHGVKGMSPELYESTLTELKAELKRSSVYLNKAPSLKCFSAALNLSNYGTEIKNIKNKVDAIFKQHLSNDNVKIIVNLLDLLTMSGSNVPMLEQDLTKEFRNFPHIAKTLHSEFNVKSFEPERIRRNGFYTFKILGLELSISDIADFFDRDDEKESNLIDKNLSALRDIGICKLSESSSIKQNNVFFNTVESIGFIIDLLYSLENDIALSDYADIQDTITNLLRVAQDMSSNSSHDLSDEDKKKILEGRRYLVRSISTMYVGFCSKILLGVKEMLDEGRSIASYCTFAIDHVVKCAAIENKITMLKHEYTVFQNHLNFYK